MPVQKGKKRKKSRRRGPSDYTADAVETAETSSRSDRTTTRRQKWKPPPWMNATFGAVMIVVGVIFYFVIPQKSGGETKLLFLVLYLALGGLYLGRAYVEYRRRQQSS